MLPRRSQFGEYPEERDPDPLARALRRPMGEPSLTPGAFDHLPRERQLGLLWRLAGPMAGYLDRDDAIEYVASCRRRRARRRAGWRRGSLRGQR